MHERSVDLTADERAGRLALLTQGRVAPARKLTRA